MKGRVQCIHFTGIGGIGMSGIAEVLHNQGYTVQGSDAAESPNVERLRALGISVFVGHAAGQLGEAQVVVASTAIKPDNAEITEAHARGIPVIPRAEMLAELMRMKQGIAVAGSHGKTTITSLIAHGMEVAGLDPTYVIGGRLIASGDNARLGESPYLVAEADESDGSFLRLTPVIAVVSNIDPEHLDHYGDFDHLLAAFRQFVSSVPFYGRVVLHHEHPNVALLRDDLHKAVTTYGRSPQADFHILEDVPQSVGQRISFGHIGSDQQVSFHLPMPGPHNAENALAAVAVLYELGMDMPTICRGMESFSGIQRRFQTVQLGGGTLVDDYGHHPTEVMATLTTARLSWPDAPALVLFQPHRYSRSRDLMNEFLGAFDDAAEVVLLPIYAAGEKPIEGVSSEVMVAGMQQRGHRNVRCCADLNEAREIAIKGLADGRIVLLMGAGSIGGLAASLRRDLWEGPK
ncbi:MAG: UDP-N-acetylmuramate--L-alanine ligase [Zetaproteobacteria bacterium CG12_big_fil_rev_8_21_14_0_65_55_1124]|nr:MAG: UDP-N-acetylmuramate--L-alanine ligase [Zetaproteobacteria bacterium CG1_02_55_237]PIS19911.1 MAG: UDP-N-acetylmuramate--L-alanine ligase [Zetaproteobacteria bacterium CG08_land_8_20_14_0_20_55_17]PIW43666.1 MAG: UDP-N-acetylmuramate--L-alanine ligase [Zetaproteobacteria bacterium CG12_big_fil_rev_8_21_14_0_65_55_1124]PIY52665.1 MAG: UDP-N-acetylmuramate--L-alanine ligase [Zetaproteobacteria bacterium CG_4_10_14_0_8_um_filter_55_43]PIZ37849.1 MAG: UDP-N-acetylmuramate--L-alanine ligase 